MENCLPNLQSVPSVEETILPPVTPHLLIPSYLTKVPDVKRSHVYTEEELAQHTSTTDSWVAVQSRILDVSDIAAPGHVSETERRAQATLVRHAGNDISYWFKTRGDPAELREFCNLKHGGMQEYFLPQGPIPDAPPNAPVTNWAVPKAGRRKTPWWNQARREVGTLTKKTRKIKVANMIFAAEKYDMPPHLLKVCSEETLKEILFRYLKFNRHGGSYTWKYEGRDLDMDKTLEENDIPDDENELKSLDIDADEYIPLLHVHFNDDLTVA